MTEPREDHRTWPFLAFALFGVAWGANQFAPMLRVYAAEVGLSEATVSATFGIYALGIAPGILLGGPLSDRFGRPAVVFPATVISLVATSVLLGATDAAPLYVARLLAGLASGLAFSAGSAWLLALSAEAGPGVGGVRNTVALTSGFALGPLTTGLVVGSVDWPLITPFLPHLALMTAGILLLLRVPRDQPAAQGRWSGVSLLEVLRPSLPARLLWVAPFSFGTAVMAFAVLPGFGAVQTPAGAGLVTATTLGVGVAVQPWARRIGVADPERLRRLGLGMAVGAFLLGAAYAVSAEEVLLGLACIAAGFTYGFVFLYGFLLLGAEATGVQVAQVYVASYIGFGFAPGIVSLSEVVPIAWVLAGFAAAAGVLALVPSRT